METRRRWPSGGALLGLWCVALLGGGTPGLALEPHRRVSQYSVDNWRSEQGLPQNTGLTLAQTSEGYLWVGTYEGLARFDGARFTVFDRSNSPQLRNHAVMVLAENAAGGLWVGTAQGLFLHEQGQLRRMEGELGEAAIFQLVREGTSLWVVSSLGLARLSLSGLAAPRRYTLSGLADATVKSVAVSGSQGVWVGTSRGLVRLVGEQVERVALPTGQPLAVEELLEAQDGTLWVGTAQGLWSLREGRFASHGPEQGMVQGKVTALLEDRDGNVWVATTHGLVRHNAAGFVPLSVPNELAGTYVHSLLEDRDGHLWVGTTNKGIFRLRSGPFLTLGGPEGSSLDSLYLVLEGRDGTLWMGSLRSGLERVQDGVVARVGAEQGLEDDNMRSLAEGPEGELWVATASGVFRQEGPRFVRVWPEPGRPPAPANSLFPDSEGGLWFLSPEGLAYLRKGQVTVYGEEQGFSNEPFRPLIQDASGTVWYGTAHGLVRFAQGTFTRFGTREGLSGEGVMSLYMEPSGALWIGTTTGLTRWKEGRFSRITTAQGLPDDTVYTLLLDEDDHFWMSSNKGIARVSRRELEEVAEGRRARVSGDFFDDRDGMRASECNGGPSPSGWRTRDGRMWFACLRGAVMVNPQDARLEHRPPRLYIEELRVQGRPVPLTERLELAPGQEDLEVRFTAFVPSGAERLPFRYRLEGYDSDWVDAEGRRAATYTRLPPGRYHFQVTAQDRAGRWVEPVTVQVTLRPWFYQTWWFYVLCGLAVCGVGASGYAWRVGRLKERERWLQARVQERTQELARANQELDGHLRELRAAQSQLVQAGKMAAVGTLAAGVGHEINNPLSYIVSNLEHACEEAQALEQLEENPEPTRERLREMRQVLREALMGADRVRRIVRDLKTFSRQDEETLGPVDLRGVMDSAAKMASGELRPRAHLVRDYAVDVPPVQGNEARLAQVFLNLIINAAQALPEGKPEENEVRLVLKRGGAGQVVAEVRDTGSGIQPEVLGRIFDPFFTTKPVGVGTGLGLALVQAFLNSMSGRIEVESEVGRGTVVRVTLPAASGPAARAPQVAAQEPGAAPARGRVLVVDDDPLVSSALRRTLAREHEVEVVESARRAWELLKSPERRYDIILCDLMMPEMTGMELHAHLEAEVPEQARRMVFITGGAYTPVAKAFLEKVSNPRVEKPFNPDRLREQVREWVAHARAGASGHAA